MIQKFDPPLQKHPHHHRLNHLPDGVPERQCEHTVLRGEDPCEEHCEHAGCDTEHRGDHRIFQRVETAEEKMIDTLKRNAERVEDERESEGMKHVRQLHKTCSYRRHAGEHECCGNGKEQEHQESLVDVHPEATEFFFRGGLTEERIGGLRQRDACDADDYALKITGERVDSDGTRVETRRDGVKEKQLQLHRAEREHTGKHQDAHLVEIGVPEGTAETEPAGKRGTETQKQIHECTGNGSEDRSVRAEVRCQPQRSRNRSERVEHRRDAVDPVALLCNEVLAEGVAEDEEEVCEERNPAELNVERKLRRLKLHHVRRDPREGKA